MKNLGTRTRIILLVVLAALPTLALIVYGALDQRTRAEMHAREDLGALVKARRTATGADCRGRQADAGGNFTGAVVDAQ